MSIYCLPKDVILLICEYLSEPKDLNNLVFSTGTFYRMLKCPCLCFIEKKCIKEIEDVWNKNLVPQVMRTRCLNFPEFCSKGCTQTANETIECSIFPWKTHYLSVEYFHFPRDIDLLTWYKDGKKMGYTMM